MRILAAQPESMGEGMRGPLTLESMGIGEMGNVFWSFPLLILKVSIYSKQVSCTLECQDA